MAQKLPLIRNGKLAGLVTTKFYYPQERDDWTIWNELMIPEIW